MSKGIRAKNQTCNLCKGQATLDESDKEQPIYICDNCGNSWDAPDEKKSKSKPSEKCPVCGGILVQIEKYGQQIFLCTREGCNKEFNKFMEYITIPWMKEPTLDELKNITLDTETLRQLYQDVLIYIKDNVILPSEINYHVMALWSISTYKMDLFDTTGYLGFYGAGNDKGKTRGLKVLYQLCYRAILAAIISPPVTSKALTDGATILIDQAENVFYDGQRRTELYSIWTSGYQKGINNYKLSSQDHISYMERSTFGAKATSMQEDAKDDHPLRRRTHIFYMQNGTPKNKYLDTETSKNLRLRLHKFKSMDLKFNKDTFLRGGSADICDPLIFTARMLGLSEHLIEKILKYAIELMYSKVDDASDTMPARLCIGIANCLKNGFEMTPKEVADMMKELYKDYEESKYYNPKQVGRLMIKLGLKSTSRRSNGMCYDMSFQHNVEVYKKAHEQYQPDSIVSKIQDIITTDFKDATVNLSLLGTEDADRLIKLYKYREMLKAKEISDVQASDIHINYEFVEEELNPEDDPHLQMYPSVV